MEPFSSYLSLNTWHHIAVYDGQFNHIYFDGVLLASSQNKIQGTLEPLISLLRWPMPLVIMLTIDRI